MSSEERNMLPHFGGWDESGQEIRPLLPEEIPAYVEISTRAFPAYQLDKLEEREYFVNRLRGFNPETEAVPYGCFRGGTLVGGAIAYRFRMQFHEVRVPIGGIGMVAVDLHHKKQHVARELVAAFHRICLRWEMPLAMLYPFRSDFYQRMGYGFGTKVDRYRIPPVSLPSDGDAGRVRALALTDVSLLADCYARAVDRTHGLMERSPQAIERLWRQQRLAGCMTGDRLGGYMVYAFRPVPVAEGENPLLNDLVVEEMVWETPESLLAMLAFLRSQADQVRLVEFWTQEDFFHFLFADPRDGSNLLHKEYQQIHTSSQGIMVRLLDARRAFRLLAEGGHDFGGISLCLCIHLEDPFLPQNAGTLALEFLTGRLVRLETKPLVDWGDRLEAVLRVEDLSSLLMGAVTLEALVNMGRVTISDSTLLHSADCLFRVPRKPVCLTRF